MKSPRSLESNIVASAAVVFAVVGSLLFLAIHHNASRASEQAFDRVLEAAALSIADTVAFDRGAVTVDIPYSAFAILGTSRLNRIFYRVVAPDGSVVTGDPVLGLDLPHASGPDVRLNDSTMQGEPIRLAAVARYRSDASTGEAGWVDVLVGETREARDQLTGQLTTSALLPVAAIALCAFGVIWVGIRMAFSPLRSIERSLERRSPSDLSPIGEDLPREVAALTGALNAFMARLNSTLEGLQRVTADAAHQLRTPLAAMRAQAEIGLEEEDIDAMRRRMRKVHGNAVSASQLAGRLLTDATLLHAIKSGKTERLDLREVVGDTIERMITEGHIEDRSLPFERPATPIWVEADPISLKEALRNVVENACQYAGGPTDISIERWGEQVKLTVTDGGTGIPHERREAVFARFERNSDTPGGTGLGLSIARDVVTALGGSVSLSDAAHRGLRVTMTLPLAAPASPTKGPVVGGMPPALALAGLSLAGAFMFLGTGPVVAQNANAFTITSPIDPGRFTPVVADLEQRFPSLAITYRQSRSAQVAAKLSAPTPLGIDLVVMAAPDLAVTATNDGLADQLQIPVSDVTSMPERPWRRELFPLIFDPAVFLVSDTFGDAAVPHSRLELAQALETDPTLFQRVGIVNVGIDAVSYALATQDSLRSPLFWRLASAFGSAQARIYDTSAELVSALVDGEIDIAYNVPLSELGALRDPDAVDLVIPQDYTLALPWVVFAPQGSRAEASSVVRYLLSDDGQQLLASVLWGRTNPIDPLEGQRIALGPELLVYRDSIKRSNFLDSWFELVTTP